MAADRDTHDEEHAGTDWLRPEVRGLQAVRTQRYSAFVSYMKIGLPLLAAVLILAITILPNALSPPAPKREVKSINATMESPVYNARDNAGRPYQVQGTEARQHQDAPGLTDIATPHGTLDLGNGKDVKGNASTAQYDQTNGTLNLRGGVTLQHSEGTTFTTQDAHVDMKNHTAEGNQPVLLQGSFGEVRGQGFKAIDGGKTIIFTGPSSAKLKLGGGANNPLGSSPLGSPGGTPVPDQR